MGRVLMLLCVLGAGAVEAVPHQASRRLLTEYDPSLPATILLVLVTPAPSPPSFARLHPACRAGLLRGPRLDVRARVCVGCSTRMQHLGKPNGKFLRAVRAMRHMDHGQPAWLGTPRPRSRGTAGTCDWTFLDYWNSAACPRPAADVSRLAVTRGAPLILLLQPETILHVKMLPALGLFLRRGRLAAASPAVLGGSHEGQLEVARLLGVNSRGRVLHSVWKE